MKYIIRLSLLATALIFVMGFTPAEKPQAKVNWISIEEAVAASLSCLVEADAATLVSTLSSLTEISNSKTCNTP